VGPARPAAEPSPPELKKLESNIDGGGAHARIVKGEALPERPATRLPLSTMA
jgi:hypothetical protein